MISTAYFMSILLVFLRMLTFFIIVPVFFPSGTPPVMKIFLAGITSFILMAGVTPVDINLLNSNYMLIIYCANEIISGITLGYITNMCFMMIRMGGQLLDIQLGFSMISIFDPTANSNVTFIERLVYWMSLVLFFIMDGHHMLLSAIIQSFKVIKLGQNLLSENHINVIINAFIQYFSIGLKIAIPIMLVMILTDITLGLISRTVPSLNVMILGLPLKILVGLTCIMFSLPIIVNQLIHMFNTLPDVYKGIFSLHAPLFLFIGATDEKTEDATPKKKKEARDKGQVAKSKEVPLAFTLLASTMVLSNLGNYVGGSLKATMLYFLNGNLPKTMEYDNITQLTAIVLWRGALVIIPIAVAIMIMGVIANYMQTGFMFSSEVLQPKLSKLNPMNWYKKVFSMKTVVELLKDLAMVGLVGYIGYTYVKANFPMILNMGNVQMGNILKVFSTVVVGIFSRVTLVMIIIGLIDYVYQKYNFNKDLKMTKQEIKQESKQEDGDPQVKGRIRQKQREISKQRMMQAVPDATVVITNPTHLAIAIKYKEGIDKAPVVVAKGADFVAQRIKEIARENGVPIIENKPLARLVFKEVDIDFPIPMEMYQAIAEILALVYKMKKSI